MSTMVPASSITRNITKLIEIDQANITAGDTTYIDAVSGLTLTFGGALSKDADGVYASADYSAPAVAGTMPALSGYIGVISISKAPTVAATVATAIFGDNAVIGVSLSSTGASNVDGANQLTGRTAQNLSTNNADIAQCAIFDFADSSSPELYYGNANSTQMGCDFIYTSASGGALTANPFESAINLSALASTAGQRFKYAALIRFDEKPSQQELMAAIYEMATTGELYSKWVD